MYRPLGTENKIRLLRVKLRGYSEPDEVHIQLRIFELNKAPMFSALSYTWGPESPSYSITIDNSSFTVRSNLNSFLEHVSNQTIEYHNDGEHEQLLPTQRDKDGEFSSWVWIDQLCIDQSSYREKSHQVQRMAEIYQEAKEVIVWLGEAEDDSGYTIRSLADLQAQLERRT